MVSANPAQERFLAIGIEPKTVQNILTNEKVTKSLLEVLDGCGVKECPKEMGSLLYAVSTKCKPKHAPYKTQFALQISEKKWTKMEQLDEGFKFIDTMQQTHGKEYQIVQEDMDKATGVGVVVTAEEITQVIESAFSASMDAIMEQKYDFNFGPFLTEIRTKLKWADGQAVRN